MAPSKLSGVDLKLGRAKEILDFLKAHPALQRTLATGEMEHQTGDFVVRVTGKPPPDELGIPISEFAHALRTALDNLLWQLILARQGTPTRATQFPINERDVDFNGPPKRKPRGADPNWPTEADRLTWGISKDDRDFIESVQPLKTATPKGHPLALLAHLNNTDKHRYIHVAYAAAAEFQVRGAERVFRFAQYTKVRGGEDIEYVSVPYGSPRFDPAIMMFERFALKDQTGAKIADLHFGARCRDDRKEVAYVPASEIPADAKVAGIGIPMQEGIGIPMLVEVSLSGDRECPMTISDFEDIHDEVSRIVEHFRPAIV